MNIQCRLGKASTVALCVLVLSEAAGALAQDAGGLDSMGKEPGTRLQARCEALRNQAKPPEIAQQADAARRH